MQENGNTEVVGKAHKDFIDAISAVARLTQKRLAELIQHGGEKGALAETIVSGFLEKFIPKRYSIGSGFIITRSGKASAQTDIVIYDRLYNSPLFFSDRLALFPVECVYATIEVKTTLRSGDLKQSIENNKRMRSLKDDKEYVTYETDDKTKEKPVVKAITHKNTLAPRSFIFAFDTDYSSIQKLHSSIRRLVQEYETHLHGVFVLDRGWFVAQRATFGDSPKLIIAEDNGVEAFCLTLLRSIDSFPMGIAQMFNYLGPVKMTELK